MSSVAVNGAAFLLAATLLASGCDSDSPTGPSSAPPREVSGTITFATAGPQNAAMASYAEAGFTVQFRSGNWEAWTLYGNPAPCPVFFSAPSAGAVGTVQITAGGALFAFRSVDLYSSLTPIPYAIVGTRAGSKEVDFGDTLPATGIVGNTFGAFRTVTTPSSGRLVDTLTVTLTNPALAGGSNPMGLDNIVLSR